MADSLILKSPSAELIEKRSSRGVRVAIALVLLIVFTALLFAAFYRIDVYATASGRVQPVGRSKTIQAVEQARILFSGVREGSHVRKGQLLVRLDPVSSVFDRNAARLEQLALGAEIARRTAEAGLASGALTRRPAIRFPEESPLLDRIRETAVLDQDLRALSAQTDVIDAKITGDEARQGSLTAMIAQKRAALATVRIKLENRRRLAAEGWRSGSDLNDTEVELDKAQDDLLSAEQDLAEVRSDAAEQRAELEATRSKLLKDNADQLEQAQVKLGQAQMQFLKNQSRTSNLAIRSPVDGTVQSLAITNVGQVANAGATLMTIVPDDAKIQIEALVSDRDMGFVGVGEQVVVKVRAYPFTRYGVVHGVISRIARDSLGARDAAQESDTSVDQRDSDDPEGGPLPHVQDLVYPVIVDLTGDTTIDVDGVRTPIKAGMAVEVEIKTATRSVLEYVLSPIRQTIADAGHER